MTETLLIIAGVAFVSGYMLKGLVLDSVNYLGADKLLISLPFGIILIAASLCFIAISDLPLDPVLCMSKAIWYSVYFCTGLILCNISQRRRGLIVE
jgi:predicted MFS family arabinose efflux permease